MQYVKEDDLVLLDRGYPAFWLFALILSRQAHFCARVKTYWKEIRKFSNSGENEAIITLPQMSIRRGLLTEENTGKEIESLMP